MQVFKLRNGEVLEQRGFNTKIEMHKWIEQERKFYLSGGIYNIKFRTEGRK